MASQHEGDHEVLYGQNNPGDILGMNGTRANHDVGAISLVMGKWLFFAWLKAFCGWVA
ncbi:hypothetical protein [Sulfobacillus thermosulfidooxidans]|uniref:hypothetical protein n=1 Tax=Sulfobacillus thermosulfidooxidans TaxID=28034 RepID=UPI0012DE37CE|nr:hypothetical protein [Sulfobacillus thermosulfidooxidans]